MANEFNNLNNQQRPQGQGGVPRPAQQPGAIGAPQQLSGTRVPRGVPQVKSASANTQAPHGAQTQQAPASRSASARTQQEKSESAATAKSGSKRTILIIVGVVVAALAIWLLVFLFACNGGSLMDPGARDGQAPYKTDEEIQAELNRVVDEGMFNISIASVIQFDDGQSNGTAYIENVPGNHYLMQVTITDDDTGDVLYESGVLKPNQYIENIALAKDLDAGVYSTTATFKALDSTTYDEVGQAAAKVTINVLG